MTTTHSSVQNKSRLENRRKIDFVCRVGETENEPDCNDDKVSLLRELLCWMAYDVHLLRSWHSSDAFK
ncbi:hypothetical protein BVRB_6g141420 [Beta vulgaris subsp. vulgaris]|nr:hypothetical protein BVRB_6g141420 [Beta vulgaris subsp. vulgaris]